MKIGFLFLLILSVGCASYAPISDVESCALRGMTLKGVGYSSSSGVATTLSGDIAVGRSSSSSYYCEVTEDERKICIIKALQNSAIPKAEYNNEVKDKNFLIGIGYVLYILPGLIGSHYMNKWRTEAIAESETIYSEEILKCENI